MSRRNVVRTAVSTKVLLAIALIMPSADLMAGGGAGFFRNNAVGGVSIDATGVLKNPAVFHRDRLAKAMKAEIIKAPGKMNMPAPIRMISLRGLEQAIRDAQKNNAGALPDEIRYLAGLQRIQYVFLYPEQNDIVLAGPGEGWKVDDKANVVGITTGRPVIQLDDLLVAFRTANNAREGLGISCSIDPTAEGRQRFERYIRSLKTFTPRVVQDGAKAMGEQVITLTGVPANSHFARVMVASDFRMKRYAMNLEEAPISGMPSFIDMLKTKRARVANAMPRWWLACNYESIGRSEDGLAWQLNGPGVKVMTEDDFIAETGEAKGSGKANPIAQEWANLMTSKYDELTRADPVFGELRNLMDLCVISALIEKHSMLDKVGLELPLIMQTGNGLEIDHWYAPKKVATECSFLKAGRQYIITASGGVQVESWAVTETAKEDADVRQTYASVAAPGQGKWWW